MRITLKQQNRVNKIIEFLGIDYVTEYINRFFQPVDMNNLTKDQAQKIITGLAHKLPRKPVFMVYGRDTY